MRWLAGPLLLVAAAGAGRAQELFTADRGTHAFRVVLHRLGLKPLASADDALGRPGKTLVVVLGDPAPLNRLFPPDGLRHFLASGGALLVATDRPTFGFGNRGGPGVLLTDLECGVHGVGMESGPADAAAHYRGQLGECPLVQEPIRDEYRSRLALLKGLTRVAANRPSLLRPTIEMGAVLNKRRVFAELPTGCRFEGLSPPQGRPLLALADRLDLGRYMVIADHSIFINEMMLQADNDNIVFAVRVTNWLTENGKRDRVLFYDEGTIRNDFDVDLDYIDPPLPHPDVLGPALDRLIGGLEGERFFDQAITNLIPAYRQLRYLLLGLTVVAAAFLLYRMAAGRYRPDPTAAHLPERLGELAGPGPATRTDDPATAAGELARRAFEGWLGAEPDWSRPPMVESSQRSWARQVRGLWDLAAGPSATRMTVSRLERVARSLDELDEAIARGEVRLAREGV